MGSRETIEVARRLLSLPYRATDPQARAGNRCTIIVCGFPGEVRYAQGTLDHGPRDGELARLARGWLLFFDNDADCQSDPFTRPLQKIEITVQLGDADVSLELRPDDVWPKQVMTIDWANGWFVGHGTWGNGHAMYLIALEDPKSL